MSPKEKTISKIYGRVLFEVVQKADKASWDACRAKLAELVDVMKSSKELTIALTTPATSRQDKAALIEVLAKKLQAPTILRNFLLLLARKGRLMLLTEINQALDGVRLESTGGILGFVTSTDPLSAADRDSLAKAFSKKLNRSVEFLTQVDPELLAGLKVSVGGVTYDGTLKGQLDRLRDRFTGTVLA